MTRFYLLPKGVLVNSQKEHGDEGDVTRITMKWWKAGKCPATSALQDNW
jgi:hypothetical protein